MEERALFSNIAMIITKDILVDEANSQKQPKHFLWHSSRTEADTNNDLRFPLLEPADDEDMEFYLEEQYSAKTPPTDPIPKEPTSNNNGNVKVKRGRVTKRKRSNMTQREIQRLAKHQEVVSQQQELFMSKRRELNLLNRFDNIDFEGFLHMSKMSFLKTFQFIKHLLAQTTFPGGVPAQTVFSLSVWKLTTDEHFEEISRRFKVSQTECEAVVNHFWHIISDKYESYIKWPNSHLSQQLQLEGFRKHSQLKIFPNLFGVLATKRLDVFMASEDAEISIILQIVTDVDQKVIDCFVELEQDYNFAETPMGQILALNENTMPRGSYLIGNKSFPLKPYLMRPFANPCFRKEQEFNYLIKPALALGQDTLDIMAKRFNALYALEAQDLGEVRKILETVCALHNLSVAIEDDYVERKRQVVQFNWAGEENGQSLNVGSEQSVLGIQRRSDLVDLMII